jgi:hypothetical protein
MRVERYDLFQLVFLKIFSTDLSILKYNCIITVKFKVKLLKGTFQDWFLQPFVLRQDLFIFLV